MSERSDRIINTVQPFTGATVRPRGAVQLDRPTIIVMAKEPVPGRVKTRLCPPCTGEQAAALAGAALHDTLTAATATGMPVLLALAGDPSRRRGNGRVPWNVPGVRVVAQHGDSFNARLANAWRHVRGPAVQIGMDTPQATAELLTHSIDQLCEFDAVLGPAADGGWWALGMRRADPTVFDDVPMSRDNTGAVQRDRLAARGWRIGELPTLTDMDTWRDALDIAATAPLTRTATLVRQVAATMVEQ